MNDLIKTVDEEYYVAERGYPYEGSFRWVGEWSGTLESVVGFLSQYHVRPDEQVRIVHVVKTETRTILN